MDKQRLQELLARARANLQAKQETTKVETIDSLSVEVSKADEVDMSAMGITNDTLKTDAGQDAAMDAIKDVIDNITTSASAQPCDDIALQVPETLPETKEIGVARKITLNNKQQLFCDTVIEGVKSGKAGGVVMVGAAGTGKTTCTGVTTCTLMDTEIIKPLHAGTKWLQAGVPGVVVLSYTRKAVSNIRHAVDERIKCHTLTIHKLIEFAPVWYDIEDPAKPGFWKKIMRFEPKRTRMNPLPPDLKVVIIEESSMVSVELRALLLDAMPHIHFEVYLGDIQQLPPIFGLAILGFKMLELPVIELTEVYRQALESPIIAIAWKILEGNPHNFSSHRESFKQYSKVLKKEVTRFRIPALEQYNKKTDAGEVKFQIWQKALSYEHGVNTAIKQFCAWEESSYYNPQDDMILCPFNEKFGTIELNKGISNYLGIKREATVHEVIAGYNKFYLAVGDRVLYDKEDAFITNIAHNSEYLGKRPQAASVHLDRWGHLQEKLSEAEKLEAQVVEGADLNIAAIEKYLATKQGSEEEEERVQAASHVVTVRLAYGEGDEVELEKASDINNLIGGYALTVHKAQGSEWGKVFFVMHNSHAVMNQRELLYTAVTRASKFLHIIAEPETFERGIKSQRIKGNTLAEKAEFFKGKKSDYDRAKKSLDEPAGEFQAGEYKGLAKPAVVVMPEPELPPQKLVKMSELVSKLFKKEARESLERHWQRAEMIWGAKIGVIPNLSYDIQQSNKIGVANAGLGYIKLNAGWCVLADAEDQGKLRDHLLNITIPHEVAHIVAARYADSRGHTDGWAMAMKLLGLPPDVYGDVPPYLEALKEAKYLLGKKKLEEVGATDFEDEGDGEDSYDQGDES